MEAHSGADREDCWRLTAIVFVIGQAKWVRDELPGRRCGSLEAAEELYCHEGSGCNPYY